MMNISLLLPYLDQIKMVAFQLHQKGWAEKNAGNFTIRIPNFPQNLFSHFSRETIDLETRFPLLEHQVFLVKAKGVCFRNLADDPTIGTGLLLVSNQGSAYQYLSLQERNTRFQPTSELLSHLLLQEYLVSQKPAVSALLHSHPLELIIFSHLMKNKSESELNQILQNMHTEIPLLLPEGIGFVPYQEPGSIELAKASLVLLEKYSLLVWERHGCLASGNSLLEAYDSIDIINKAASIYIGLRSIGIREEINEKNNVINLSV
jgi:rhamnulose-1-phosphate aldolase